MIDVVQFSPSPSFVCLLKEGRFGWTSATQEQDGCGAQGDRRDDEQMSGAEGAWHVGDLSSFGDLAAW